MSVENVSVIGLGRLGAPLAAVCAGAGMRTVGADISIQPVDAFNQGRVPVEETGLAELLAQCRDKISATTDIEAAVRATDLTILIVPTPSGANGLFEIDAVLSACTAIGRALRVKNSYHLVVVSSTVLPGSMDLSIVPALETASGKKIGRDFGVCYSPEFVALGSVIRDLRFPDLVLIGESDDRAGKMLAEFYSRICLNLPAVRRMNFVNAEITKISVNTFVTTKISYANMLAEICERVPGADAAVVTGALGEDSRIGSKYLKGALGYAGPCFPRDNVAFSAWARSLGVRATLAEATDEVNSRQASRLGDLVGSLLPDGGRVGILGLAYKPGTNVVDESQGVALAALLAGRGAKVIAYDPAANDAARRQLPGSVTFASTFEDCVEAADVIVLVTPWDEFRDLPVEKLAARNRRPVIVDCWRMWTDLGLQDVADYILIGAGSFSGARKKEMAQA